MPEHEIWLTRLFNDYLAGLGNWFLSLARVHAEHPARPWTNFITMQIVVAAKVSPSAKSAPLPPCPVSAGQGAAPARSRVAQVRPRTLSHVLLFTPHVARMLKFSEGCSRCCASA